MSEHPLQTIINLSNENARLRKRWTKAYSVIQLIQDLMSQYRFKPHDHVEFSTGRVPGDFMSYRWSYCELALDTSDTPKCLGDFLSQLEAVDWTVYHGYKGWDFKMSSKDVIHVAEYGCCSDDYITGISFRESDNTIILNLSQIEDLGEES